MDFFSFWGGMAGPWRIRTCVMTHLLYLADGHFLGEDPP